MTPANNHNIIDSDADNVVNRGRQNIGGGNQRFAAIVSVVIVIATYVTAAAVAAAAPAVAALPGAQSGRMDLSRDGPRFGHRKPDPESPKKWAAKLAAKKAARHRAFLVHLGQHPIH